VAERLRAAEVARATADLERTAAQAQAAAERKRRRLTAALAAAVLALGLLGGGGAWWLAEKRAEAERTVDLACREARGLHEQARAAGAGDLLAWTKAVEVAQRADGLAAGGWVSASLRQEAAELYRQVREEFADVGRDRDLLTRLAEIRTQKEAEFSRADPDGEYARAFREYGLDLDRLPDEAAARVRARPAQVVAELTAALDDWALERRRRGRPEADWRRLLDVARAADADPWRQALRAALGGRDRDAVLRLADRAEAARLPVQSVQLLALALVQEGAGGRAEAVLRAALRRHPGDVWLNHALAVQLFDQKPPRLDEAIRFFTAARAVRPEVCHHLGFALMQKGDLEEAAAVFQELTRLRRDNFHPHYSLGLVLYKQGRFGEAAAAYRDALRLRPDQAYTHNDLGRALDRQGKLDEAAAAYRDALRHQPDLADAHHYLGGVLARQGRLEEAAAAYRDALRHQPDLAAAQCLLGFILRQLGQFAEGLTLLKRGHELGSKDPRWPYSSPRWIREAERLIEAETKLPAFLRGEARPADDDERLALAEVCHNHRRHRAAARLSAEAFAARPALADDVQAGHRCRAACAAALAGHGRGEDAPPDGPGRARWRQQGLQWMRAELAANAKLVESGKPDDRTFVQARLRRLQRDPELASLRDAAALARLPEAERDGWRRLWDDVAALLGRASAPR
jgi:tetratricopeptide (TPR) repeat protein